MNGWVRPVDHDERLLIAERVDQNMCVEAGAGTGKTTVLVSRIVNVLKAGHDVRRMAVITFTEKAAAELAGRVRRGLELARDEGNIDERERESLERSLRNLNAAHIETIHAFAASLLRERPVEADLDPGFTVLDVLPAQLAFEAEWGEWLTGQMAEEEPPAALVEALNAGLDPKKIREAAESLHEHREVLPLAPFTPTLVRGNAILDGIEDGIALLRTKIGLTKVDGDAAHDGAAQIIEWYEDVVAVRSDDDAVKRAIAALKFPGYNGAQRNWHDADDCRQTKAALDRISDTLVGARTLMREKAVAVLLDWLQGFVRSYEQRRRNEGKADFDDLLIWARDLVTGNDEVRHYFQDRYQTILVDEFQDTDPMQAQIIVALCAEAGTMPVDWRRTRLRPGSLFVVGDPKQSIYRFRRADITMYDEVKTHVFGGGPRRIVQNFRSAQPIIDYVNRTFGRLFDAAEGVQPQYIDLAAHPDFISNDAVTIVRAKAPGTNGDKKPSIDDVRRFEAAKLAMLIRSNVEAGSWSVREKEDGVPPRPARYRDVVVLIPTRTRLELYEDAFARADVPYRHEGGRTFFLRQEVRELVAVLRAIDDPGDGVAVVAALRSAAFGCSDEELLVWKHGGGRFDSAWIPDGATGHVADALHTLRELAKLRHEKILPELVRETLDRTRLVEFAMLQPQGEQVAANLLKVIDQARTFTEASGRGLRGFVRWLKDNMVRATDETDAPVSEETDDVVRIVTIHASKGLEFPIVVFANMAGDRRDYTTVIRDSAAGRLHVKIGQAEDGFRTPGYEDAETNEKQHTLAEEVRLLYVAATRAKDRLVLSFIDNKDPAKAPKDLKSLNDRLCSAGGAEGECIELEALGMPEGELPVWRGAIDGAADDTRVQRLVADRDAWGIAHHAVIAAAAERAPVKTASGLKPEWELAHASEGGVRRSRATEFGTAVHAVLERVDVRRPEHIDDLAEAVAQEFGMAAHAPEIAQIADRALASEVMQRALRSRHMLRETPFAASLDGDVLAEGRLDLLFEEDGGLVVVDFKTDNVSARDMEQRAAVYRNQALIYGWAAARATGMPVREVVLLFASPGIEHRTPVDAAFIAEAEQLLRSADVPAAVPA